MQKILFLCFVLVAAAQDLRQKQVNIVIYATFGAAALAVELFHIVSGEGMYSWMDFGASISLGLGLLGIGVLSNGAIGTGDGCFFAVSGLLLGFWENLALMCYGILSCGLFCLGYYVLGHLRGGENLGKRTVPFLPFVVLPAFCMAVPELWQTLAG